MRPPQETITLSQISTQEEWEERSSCKSCKVAREMRRQKVASGNDQEREGVLPEESNQKGGVKRYTR